MHRLRGSILIAGALMAVFVWVLDSAIGYALAEGDQTFMQILVTPGLDEGFDRGMLALIVLCAAWAASRVLGVLGDRNERITHLNSVLQAIHGVNKLLVRERDVDTLLAEACELLVRECGYTAAWIVHVGDDGALRGVSSCGLDGAHQALRLELAAGRVPACMARAEAAEAPVVMHVGSTDCAGCPLQPRVPSEATTVAAMRRGTDLEGFLGIVMPPGWAEEDDELDVIHEIAGDLALGLHGIEAEDELHRNEERFRTLFDRSADAIFIHHVDGALLDVNEAACELLGYSRDELLSLAPERITADGSLRCIREPPPEHQCAGTTFSECDFLRSDGTAVPVEMNARVIEYEGERRLLNIVRDVSYRKRVEREVRELGRFREAIIDQTNTAVVVFDPMGYVLVWNRAMAEITGYAAEEVMGRNAWLGLLRDEEEVARVRRLVQAASHQGEAFTNVEVVIRTRDGRERVMSWYARQLADDDGRPMGAVAMGRDVTEHRELEARLERAQRLEAIGRLAGGVAHDFNNILTAIIGNTRLLEDEPLSEQGRARLEDIREAGERSAKLTRELLTFGRKARTEPTVFDLNTVISEMRSVLTGLTRGRADLAFRLTDQGAPVRADRTQIEQVILNLSLNARDAMHDGGTISIATARVDVGPEQAAQMTDLLPGPFVTLTVSDTGSGMDEATVARIFEPFFTTRKGGTGLGLATVYGAVHGSGGEIEVVSAPGEGTTFTVYLPLAETDDEQVQSAMVISEDQAATRVLLVEDEPSVRQLMTLILTSEGYHVTGVEGVQAALELLETMPEPPEVLLADLVMPGMDGAELAQRLRTERPNLPVLLISGYPNPCLPDGTRWLQKPFEPEELLEAVGEALTQGRG